MKNLFRKSATARGKFLFEHSGLDDYFGGFVQPDSDPKDGMEAQQDNPEIRREEQLQYARDGRKKLSNDINPSNLTPAELKRLQGYRIRLEKAPRGSGLERGLKAEIAKLTGGVAEPAKVDRVSNRFSRPKRLTQNIASVKPKILNLTYNGKPLYLEATLPGAKTLTTESNVLADKDELEDIESAKKYAEGIQYLVNSAIHKSEVGRFIGIQPNGRLTLLDTPPVRKSLKQLIASQGYVQGFDKEVSVDAEYSSSYMKEVQSKKAQKKLREQALSDRNFDGKITGPLIRAMKNPHDVNFVRQMMLTLGIEDDTELRPPRTNAERQKFTEKFHFLSERKVHSDLISAGVIRDGFDFENVRKILIKAGKAALGDNAGNNTWIKRLARGRTSEMEKERLYFARGAYLLYKKAEFRLVDLASAFASISGIPASRFHFGKSSVRQNARPGQVDNVLIQKVQKQLNQARKSNNKYQVRWLTNKLNELKRASSTVRYGRGGNETLNGLRLNQVQQELKDILDGCAGVGNVGELVRMNPGVSINLVLDGYQTRDIEKPDDTEEVIREWIEKVDVDTVIKEGEWIDHITKTTHELTPITEIINRETHLENVKTHVDISTLVENLKDSGGTRIRTTVTTKTTTTGEEVTVITCETTTGKYDIIVNNKTKEIITTTTTTTTKGKEVKVTKYHKKRPKKTARLIVSTQGRSGFGTSMDLLDPAKTLALTFNKTGSYQITDATRIYGRVGGSARVDGTTFGNVAIGLEQKLGGGLSVFAESLAGLTRFANSEEALALSKRWGLKLNKNYTNYGLTVTNGVDSSDVSVGFDQQGQYWIEQLKSMAQRVDSRVALKKAQEMFGNIGTGEERKHFINLAKAEIAAAIFSKQWGEVAGTSLGLGKVGIDNVIKATLRLVTTKEALTQYCTIPHSIEQTFIEHNQIKDRIVPLREVTHEELRKGPNLYRLMPQEFIDAHLPQTSGQRTKRITIEVYGAQESGVIVRPNGDFSYAKGVGHNLPTYELRTLTNGQVVIEVYFGNGVNARHGTDIALKGSVSPNGRYQLQRVDNRYQKKKGISAPRRRNIEYDEKVKVYYIPPKYRIVTKEQRVDIATRLEFDKHVQNEIISALKRGKVTLKEVKLVEQYFRSNGHLSIAHHQIKEEEKDHIDILIEKVLNARPKQLSYKYLASQISLARMQHTSRVDGGFGRYKQSASLAKRLKYGLSSSAVRVDTGRLANLRGLNIMCMMFIFLIVL